MYRTGFVHIDKPATGAIFHTAASVYINDNIYVIDPLFSKTGLLTLQEWAKTQGVAVARIVTSKKEPNIIDQLESNRSGRLQVRGYDPIYYKDKTDFCVQFLNAVNMRFNGGRND